MIAGQFDDPYQLDEKGIFDLVTWPSDLGGIPGARRPPAEDVFTGFNIFSIALEVPIDDSSRMGFRTTACSGNSTDSLLRVWSSIIRQQHQTVDTGNVITGVRAPATSCRSVAMRCRSSTPAWWARSVRQVPAQSPMNDVTNFGADILFPVLVREPKLWASTRRSACRPATVATLKGPRWTSSRRSIWAGRSRSRTASRATLSRLTPPSIPASPMAGALAADAPNRNQVNVNSVLISLIVAGDPAAGLAKGTEVNDKNYLDRFPFLAPAHQGLFQGHGGINLPTVPNIPNPNNKP